MYEVRKMKNMVDERFELCSLAWRYVPNSGYNEKRTEYQHEIEEKFKAYANHPAVEYLKWLDETNQPEGVNTDAVPKFALNLEKKDGDFVFINDDLSTLTDDHRWTDERARKLLKLLNDFYKDTNYAEFYNSKISFFEQETQRFIEASYSKIDFEWLAKHTDISTLKCIHSPSLSNGNTGAFIGHYFYSVVPINASLNHEYCHRFANPLALKWYQENDEFKKMCDDTAALKKISWYLEGFTYACEYVTRAYDILYNYQHGEDIIKLFFMERNSAAENSFPYIGEIYKMVLELENLPPPDNFNASKAGLWSKLVTSIAIKGMKCEICTQTVKTALEKLDGVVNVEVNLATGYADVTLNEMIASAEPFQKAIANAGCEAVGFDIYVYVHGKEQEEFFKL